MWIFTSDSFVSIVEHRADAGKLIVRGRFAGDAARFLGVSQRLEHETPDADYRFRIVAKRATVEAALVRQVRRVRYDNFKNSMRDAWRKSIAMHVWSILFGEQEKRHPKPSRLGPNAAGELFSARADLDELEARAAADRGEFLESEFTEGGR